MKRLAGLLLFFIVLTGNLCAQSLEEAKKLYLEGNYIDSKPAFEKAIKASPKNASYNQWYGTCLMEAGEIEAAEPYLKFAADKNIPGAFRSLGKLYFIQYRFGESRDAYQEYLNVLNKKKDKDENEISAVKPLLEKSKKAARMLTHCEDVQIIDSIIVDKDKFLNYYKLGEESGSLQYMDNDRSAVIYENQLKDRKYYAKKGSKGLYGLYSQTKLLDNWSDETAISLLAESEGNENYPYVLSDGVTIYFAATGNESIGGYDLFITRYNMNSDTYFAPEQLSMPFNSPYNDYMIAIDEFNGVGYFATDRFQPEGKVVIYTFIPNEEKKNIESDDSDYIANRAKIESIRASWVSGANYTAFLEKLNSAATPTKREEKGDFSFVINDNIVYHQLNEFESDAAKDFFLQSQSMNKDIAGLEKQLNDKRLEYSKGNDSKKQSMKDSILADEKKLDELYDSCRQIEIKARNTEIKHLRQ